MEQDTYSLLRHFADSWFLLLMFLFFVGAVLRLYRPSARSAYENAASVPFRNDSAPAPSAPESEEDRP